MKSTVSVLGGELHGRAEALDELLGLSRARVRAPALADASALLERITARRRLSPVHTVVALAGATGSGKSSLFNALAGLELSETGVRRPTTAAPVACAWEPRGAAGLLDRLGVPPRARFGRCGLRDGVHTRPGESEAGTRGLVLLDLPDHDSVADEHRRQVERLLALVDAVVWVLDPEKYADVVLHERYLRPLARHADVMIVVLNQADRLPGDAAEQVLDDLRRLLDEDGLAVGEHGEAGAVVLATSALTGDGVPDLRAEIGRLVRSRAAAALRLAADLDREAARLRPLYVVDGPGAVPGLTDAVREAFAARLADSVGVAAVAEQAEREWAQAARLAYEVPWLRRWPRVRAWRPARGGRCAWPRVAPAAARPVVAEAVRGVADEAARGLPTPWARAVREAARKGGRGLAEALDEAAAGAERRTLVRPAWWSAAGVAQWLLLVLALTGAVWWGAVGAGASFGSAWAAGAMSGVGVCGGLLLARVCRAAARGAARRYGQQVERRLRKAVAECGRAEVLEPVAAELMRYREVREQYGIVAGH